MALPGLPGRHVEATPSVRPWRSKRYAQPTESLGLVLLQAKHDGAIQHHPEVSQASEVSIGRRRLQHCGFRI
jgi:hypothetical protein